jgi:hypothetical protein
VTTGKRAAAISKAFITAAVLEREAIGQAREVIVSEAADFAFADEVWKSEIESKLLASAADRELPPAAVDEARRRIETVAGLYRHRRQRRTEGAMLPAEVRKQLPALRDAIQDVQERLRRIVEHQPIGWALSLDKGLGALRELELELYLLAGDLDQAPHTTARRPEQDAYYLIGVLVGIWRELTGTAASASRKRSNKSRAFVEAILRIAAPDIGSGTITRAIKQARSR